MASVDFFSGSGGGAKPSNSLTTTYDDNSDTEELVQGFKTHLSVNQSEDLTDDSSDFFPPATRQTRTADTSQLDALLSKLSDDSNYFNLNEHEDDDDDVSSIQTPTTNDIMGHNRASLRESSSDFFDLNVTPRSDVPPKARDESPISTDSPKSNFFKADDIDATSRSVSSEIPEVTERSLLTERPMETDRSGITERSMVTDTEFTERSLEIDATPTPQSKDFGAAHQSLVSKTEGQRSGDQNGFDSQHLIADDLSDEEGGWSTMETPTSNYFKLNDKASDMTDIEVTERSEVTASPDYDSVPQIKATKQSASFSALQSSKTKPFGATYGADTSDIDTTERSDLTPTPDSAMFGQSESPTDSQSESPMFGQSGNVATGPPKSPMFGQSKNIKQKPMTQYESDIARKYNTMQKQRNTVGNNEFKSNFVSEMLTRAQDNQRSTSSSSNERPTSAGKYPRGVVLSKTYTKNAHTKTFKAWSENKPNKTVSRFQKHGGVLDDGVVCTSPPVVSPQPQGGGDSPPEWKTHQPFGLDLESSGRSDGTFSSLSNTTKSPAVIGDSYYQSILQTTPLSHPATPTTPTNRSALHSRAGDSKSKQTHAKRPPSATKSRPSSAELKTQAKSNDNNGGFTVVGTKQDVGPKRPKSTHGRYRSDHKPSYVDELLFGKPSLEPDFPSPFGDTSANTKPLPFVAIASIEPPQKANGNLKNSSARSAKSSSSATRTSAGTRSNVKVRGKQNFNQSYVDEGLFGPRPDEPTFKAPWDKTERRKPFVFDGTDCKPNQSAGSVSQSRREREQSASKKPVWR